MQADILTAVILPTSLFIIMLGLGLSLRTEDFTRVIKQPKAALIGLCAQVVALPFIALLVAVLFKLPPELAVGLMIISFAPGGATSTLFTNLAKGDAALSISLTAVTSLITPFTLPLFTVLAMNYFMGNGEVFELPVLKIIMQLVAISVLPVMIGMLVLSKWQNAARKADAVIRVFSIVFLFLIIAAIILDNKTQMADFFLATGLATLTLNILVLALGYGLALFFKLSRAQAVSIGYEVGLQNGTLALLVAGTLIGNSTMMIPAVTYSILMFFTGLLFGAILKKLSSDESRL